MPKYEAITTTVPVKEASMTSIDQPIPYLVNDDPIPYRVRVTTPSPELRSFVVPRLGILGSETPPDAPPSGAPPSGVVLGFTATPTRLLWRQLAGRAERPKRTAS